MSFPRSSGSLIGVAALWLLLSASGTTALERLELALGSLSGADWSVSGLQLQLTLGQSGERPGDAFNLIIGRIHHPLLERPLTDSRIQCTSGRVSGSKLHCNEGRLQLHHPALDSPGIDLSFDWDLQARKGSLRLRGIAIAAGTLETDLRLDSNAWELKVRGDDLDLQRLGDRIPELGNHMAPFGPEGRIDATLILAGRGDRAERGEWRFDFREIAFSDAEALYMGEGIAGGWRGRFRTTGRGWSGEQQLRIGAGGILTPQFYLDPDGEEIKLSSGFNLNDDASRLRLSSVRFQHPGVLNFEASGILKLGEEPGIEKLNLQSGETGLKSLFLAYLQPLLADPSYEAMELAGSVQANAKIEAGAMGLNLIARGVHLELPAESEGNAGTALYGIDAELHWNQSEPAEVSRIRWEGGTLLGGISLGPSELRLGLQGDRVQLEKQASIPLFDGQLVAEGFELSRDETGPSLRFQGYLTPVSMEAFSAAVGWPVLSGQVSGMIPGVSFSGGTLKVDGTMLVKLFGGEILVRQLQLEDLFGVLPALNADIEMKGIDLETLTRTFSFGKITGKLEGHVKQLRLEDWQPVAFDARFSTPVDDRSRHRISQRAVDNISNLGGSGVSGALSRSFLRFFEEFGYQRLGISCRLENGVCRMAGVEPAPQGYYLVKGGGIPRIDILGYNRETDWDLLVAKLKQISQGGAPVIE